MLQSFSSALSVLLLQYLSQEGYAFWCDFMAVCVQDYTKTTVKLDGEIVYAHGQIIGMSNLKEAIQVYRVSQQIFTCCLKLQVASDWKYLTLV